MEYYIINQSDDAIEGHKSSLMEDIKNLISMITMMIMPKASPRCSFSHFVFYFDFKISRILEYAF